MKPRLLQQASLPELLIERLEQTYELVPLATLTPDLLAAQAKDFRVLLTNGEAVVGRALIESLPNLELIADFGVGYDGIDLAAARQQGVVVSNTPGVLTDDVADLALALLLAVSRRIPAAQAFIEQGDWAGGSFPWTRKVSGAHLGIVGLGRIGTSIARRAQAFDMVIGYTDREPKPGVPYEFHPSLLDLAEYSDFLVVSSPGGAGTSALIDKEVLKALGPDGYLVNISRGTVVDQEALVAAIADGTIAGAALDVFAHEPDVPAGLLGRPNVVVTPHMASATWQTRAEMCRLVADNVDSWFARKTLVTPVPTD